VNVQHYKTVLVFISPFKFTSHDRISSDIPNKILYT